MNLVNMTTLQWLRRLLLALAASGAPALAFAQTENPWRPPDHTAPRYAPVEPSLNEGASPTAGSYAPLNLEQTLAGVRSDATARMGNTPAPTAGQIATLQTPSASQPGSATVVPPYAGLPLTQGYGYLPVAPGATYVYPTTGYAGTYGLPGYGGYPGYGTYPGYGGYSGYGMPGLGNGWNGNNTWNGWSPGGFGFPMGGLSPFGFW